MTTSDRFSTERKVKRWIQAGMVMQDAVDSAASIENSFLMVLKFVKIRRILYIF